MSDLSNSRRRLYKATYAPIEVEDGRPEKTNRAVQKAAFVTSLGMRPAEVELVGRRLTDRSAPVTQAFEVVSQIARAGETANTLHFAKDLAGIDADALVNVARALLEVRRDTAAHVEQLVRDLRAGYLEWLTTPPASPTPSTTPAPSTPPSATPLPATGSTVPAVTQRVVRETTASGQRVQITTERTPGKSGGQLVVEVAPVAGVESAVTNHVVAAPTVTIEEAIRWSIKAAPASYAALAKLAADHHSVPMAYSNVDPAMAISHVVPKAAEGAKSILAAIDAFQQMQKVEPVGRLHLERLQMTPVGIERGELISSIPLTPKETVNISHREWSIKSQEFESIVQDQFEGYSEQGVAEKTDIAQSTENQRRHSSALSFNANANASYLGVTLSSSVGYNANSSDDTAQRDSRNHTIDATRRASARVKKDHKTSFKVSSVVGAEDMSVRVITNPSDTLPMRVDYYQMMRKWRVDLFRYGLRMTYDLVIPNPGSDLIRKLEQLAELDAKLSNPFQFSLKVTDVTAGNWQSLSALYQANIDAPPIAKQSLQANATIQKTEDDKEKYFVGAVEINVDNDYVISAGKVVSYYYYHDVGDDDYDLIFDVVFDQQPGVKNTLFDSYPTTNLSGSIIGRSGHVSIPYFHRGVQTASINVMYDVSVRPEVYQAWQARSWASLRAGAEAIFQQRQQQLQDQRATLVASLAPFDTLTLRRMEQEEIMKGVMRWLFGPSFKLLPADIENILNKMDNNDPYSNDALDPSSLNNAEWARMMEFGEFIKYVQHAIEWENVLYFTYPYFWDTPKHWTLKQFMEYPDAMHRAFLRAGAARVVLTIRPGFEKSFAALIDNGVFGKVFGDHPYVTIAEEIQNYAKTNYPGIPPANPANPNQEEEVDKAEQGVLTATWWEYTPTSALDLSINTPLADLS